MRVGRLHLYLLCFAGLAVTTAGCGNPTDSLPTRAGASVAADVVPATSTAGATDTREARAIETEPPAPSTPEPLASAATTAVEPVATPPPSSPTAEIEPVATKPAPCRKISFGTGQSLTAGDLAARGRGDPVRTPFLGVNLVIRSIGVNAQFVVRAVGPDGAMPRVGNASSVAWYDFSQWPGLGGTPGTDHGNVIVAGDYDDLGVPEAVFYRLSELSAGDVIQINTSDGRTLAYEVEFNKVTAVDALDWSEFAAATPEESISLITAAARLNMGRRIVWGRALGTSCSQ